jgi:hypothetical protein
MPNNLQSAGDPLDADPILADPGPSSVLYGGDWNAQPQTEALAEFSGPDCEPGRQAKHARTTIRDWEGEETGDQRFPVSYPGDAARILGRGETAFGRRRNELEASGKSKWEPFADQDEWELAEWLMKRVNQTGTEEFLKLSVVRLHLSCLTFV